ncbi:hypothetical protein C8R47DRAFT_257768 [Mycena vitilis]|nr:hypothetical protein C8R47DRAFT_257768 [Mycena vitilis]
MDTCSTLDDYRPVILQVGQTAVATLPRVLLTANCTVFRDHLASLDATDGDTTILNLSEGAAEVKEFLKALIIYNYFLPPPADPRPHECILAVFKLSNRYGAESPRRTALFHLEARHYYWDVGHYRDARRGTPMTVPPHHIRDSTSIAEKLEVIQAIEQAQMGQWMLPMLYYDSHRLLADGCQLPDSAIARIAHECGADDQQIQLFERVRRFGLPSFDRRAMAFLCEADERNASCRTPQRCLQTCFDLMGAFLPVGAHDPLYLVEWEIDELKEALCSTCAILRWKSRMQFLKALWAEIPSLFEIEDWNTLIAKRDAQMRDAPSYISADELLLISAAGMNDPGMDIPRSHPSTDDFLVDVL